MRMYNPQFEKIPEYKEITYKENVTIRFGYCDVTNEYAINAMKRFGFEEVKEFVPMAMPPITPTVVPTFDPKAVTVPSLENLTIQQLRKKANELGTKTKRTMKKDEIIALIEAKQP